MPNPFYRSPQNNQQPTEEQLNNFAMQLGNANPRQIIANLLGSGRMTKEQFDYYSQQAIAFRNSLSRR